MAKWDHLLEIHLVKDLDKSVTVSVSIDTGPMASIMQPGVEEILMRIGLLSDESMEKLLNKLRIKSPLQFRSMVSRVGFGGINYQWLAKSKTEGKSHVDKIFKYVSSFLRKNPTVDERSIVPVHAMAFQGDPRRPTWKYARDFEVW